MKIRTSSGPASSLNTASFRIVRGIDARGLVYRCRREIMTLRRLRQDPFPAQPCIVPRGRIATLRSLHLKRSAASEAKVMA